MNPKQIAEFVSLANSRDPIDAYTDAGAARKAKFLRLGRAVMRELAKELDLTPGSYDIRVQPGGIAVAGDVILHSDWLYVQFGQLTANLGFMYRSCDSRKDYRGGANRWLPYERLLRPGSVSESLRRLKPESKDALQTAR